MKKLKSNIVLSELDTFVTNAVRIFGEFPELNIDEFLVVEFRILRDLAIKLNTAIKQDRINNKLDELDTKRRDSLRSLSRIVKAYVILPVDEIKQSANVVSRIFEKYKKAIWRENYSSASSSINSLLEDLKAPKVLEAMSRLNGISEIVEIIKDSQNNFVAEYDIYMENISNKGASASSYKEPILELVNLKIRRYLDTMVMINQSKYGEFTKRFEMELNRANSTVKTKKTKELKDESENK